MVSTITWNMIFWLALLPVGSPLNGQSQSYAQTRSPHGNLNIPCQNCHTALGWKPIRAVPEFDHNSTRFPLRGLHAGVACANCHTIRGTDAGSRFGPDLTHIASRNMIAAETLPNTRGAMAGWILDPQRIKPGTEMSPNSLAPDDLQALLAYLQTLQ